MRLSLFTNYALRTLMYLGRHSDRLSTVTEISDYYGMSRHHLVKVVHHLGKQDFINTTRGKDGGITLAYPLELINLRDVIEACEKEKALLECFDDGKNSCVISQSCRLKVAFDQAINQFLCELERYTLADLLDQSAPCSMVGYTSHLFELGGETPRIISER